MIDSYDVDNSYEMNKEIYSLYLIDSDNEMADEYHYYSLDELLEEWPDAVPCYEKQEYPLQWEAKCPY